MWLAGLLCVVSWTAAIETDLSNIESNCTKEGTIIERLLDHIHTGKYKRSHIPVPEGVTVTVEYWVQEISTISETYSNFEVDAYINEIWLDPGLAYASYNPCRTNITLNEEVRKDLWSANSNFVNSKIAKIHDSPFKNVFLMLFPNGTAWANYRVKIKGKFYMTVTQKNCETAG